jgi:prolyl-tRNA synthetase
MWLNGNSGGTGSDESAIPPAPLAAAPDPGPPPAPIEYTPPKQLSNPDAASRRSLVRLPDGKGTLSIKRGIEVGHIFQLGNKYSKAMNVTVQNEEGKSVVLEMGCYGIGVSRVVAACIEQCHDDNGIIWPDNIAPFQVVLIPLNAHKSEMVTRVCEELYAELQAMGIEVLMDDRDRKTSPGVKFADMDLIGIPHRIVLSDRHLENAQVEYKHRSASEAEILPLEGIAASISGKIRLR